MSKPPMLSVVDYGAWERGYMPPSEHVLIDQLSYRGARVVMSSDYGDVAFWLVIRGKTPTGKRNLALRKMIEEWLDQEDAGPAADQSNEPPCDARQAKQIAKAVEQINAGDFEEVDPMTADADIAEQRRKGVSGLANEGTNRVP